MCSTSQERPLNVMLSHWNVGKDQLFISHAVGCNALDETHGWMSYASSASPPRTEECGMWGSAHLWSQSQCESVNRVGLNTPKLTENEWMMCSQWSCSRQHLSACTNIPAWENNMHIIKCNNNKYGFITLLEKQWKHRFPLQIPLQPSTFNH